MADLRPSIRIDGRLERADLERGRYVYVPFDVPAGVRALRIGLRYEPRGDAGGPTDGAVLDLGLFGPGSLAFGTDAFRGWSGSERTMIVLGETRATPGYRPGPIQPGGWNAILGLYKVPEAGCEYALDLELLDEEPATSVESGPQRSSVEPVQPAGPRWYACDLHAHSVHSDGIDELSALAAAARRAGLDVLVVTDHNTDSHHPHLSEAAAFGGLSLIPGEEVTTYHGHANAIGATAWVDFRHGTPEEMGRAFDAVHAAGGLASINHPRGNDCGWELGDDVAADLVEVWNGPWSDADEQSLAWWYQLLAAGHRPTPAGGSDCHDASDPTSPLGTPTTWVHAAEPSPGPILDGLASGRVVLTAGPGHRPPQVEVEGASVRWQIPASTEARRLVLRSVDAVVGELQLPAGPAAGHYRFATHHAALVAAELRSPSDALLALVPLLGHGG